MASISSYNASSINTLFSSLNARNTSYFNPTSMYSINLSDYSTIKSGSYFKLLKSYYAESSEGSKKVLSTSTSDDSVKTLNSIQKSAESLMNSAQELYSSGNKSVFRKNENGEYDVDAIYSKVSQFVDDYNSLIESTEDTNTENIARNSTNMINLSEMFKQGLSGLGITIDTDDFTLKIDETKFKTSDMSKVQSMFQGAGSYAYSMGTKAAMINSNAQLQLAKSNTYNSYGAYSNSYLSGSLFSSFI